MIHLNNEQVFVADIHLQLECFDARKILRALGTRL